MNRITKDAEESNAIPTAKHKNNTAFTGSVPDENISDRSGEEEMGKRHSFSKKLAAEIYAKKRKLNLKAKNAAHECIVLKYLAYKVRASKNEVGGKKWFYSTVEELAKVFPYLAKTTIYEIVLRLKKLGYLEISNFNKWHRDKTFWYHVPRTICDAAESDLIYFDSVVAAETSVPAAVLLGNFQYWMKQHEKSASPLEVHLSPSKLVELLPFSLSTIKLGLATLEQKHIKKLSKKEPLYGLPEINGGLNPNNDGLNPNSSGSNPNSDGLNPNDITHCKPVSNPLKTSSKPKPTASVFEDPADGNKANDELTHLFHHDIAPCADEQDGEEITYDNEAEQNSLVDSSPATTQETGKPRSFSFFDAPASCQNAEDPSVAEVHFPSTADMADAVEHVGGKWPVVDSLEELHQINHDKAEAVEKLVSQAGSGETFRRTILNVCATTMGMLELSTVDELYDDPEGDEIIQKLLPHFHRFLDQTSLEPSTELSQIIYHAALECMVGAFLWPREKHNSYSHPMHPLISVTRRLYLILWRRGEEARMKGVAEEFAQWRQQYASVDEHKENDPDLSPAEKMRVFRNALHTRNEVGWIWFDQTHQTHRIQVSNLGLQRIQRLFELNPDLTPANLLPVVDGCMNEYSGRPAPPKKFVRGVYWHARMGHRLHLFASYLETIVKQLGMKSPVKVYLSDAKTEEEEGVALAA